MSAYLHVDDFQAHTSDTLHKIVFGSRAHELNSIAYAKLQQEPLNKTAVSEKSCAVTVISDVSL